MDLPGPPVGLPVTAWPMAPLLGRTPPAKVHRPCAEHGDAGALLLEEDAIPGMGTGVSYRILQHMVLILQYLIMLAMGQGYQLMGDNNSNNSETSWLMRYKSSERPVGHGLGKDEPTLDQDQDSAIEPPTTIVTSPKQGTTDAFLGGSVYPKNHCHEHPLTLDMALPRAEKDRDKNMNKTCLGATDPSLLLGFLFFRQTPVSGIFTLTSREGISQKCDSGVTRNHDW